MRQMIRWGAAAIFVFAGGYILLWAIQSASYSVAADPVMKALYETRAMVLYPVSVLYVSMGLVIFYLLRSKS